jgi:hypothetical protein
MLLRTYSKEEVNDLIQKEVGEIKNELIQHIGILEQKNRVLEEKIEQMKSEIINEVDIKIKLNKFETNLKQDIKDNYIIKKSELKETHDKNICKDFMLECVNFKASIEERDYRAWCVSFNKTIDYEKLKEFKKKYIEIIDNIISDSTEYIVKYVKGSLLITNKGKIFMKDSIPDKWAYYVDLDLELLSDKHLKLVLEICDSSHSIQEQCGMLYNTKWIQSKLSKF